MALDLSRKQFTPLGLELFYLCTEVFNRDFEVVCETRQAEELGHVLAKKFLVEADRIMVNFASASKAPLDSPWHFLCLLSDLEGGQILPPILLVHEPHLVSDCVAHFHRRSKAISHKVPLRDVCRCADVRK